MAWRYPILDAIERGEPAWLASHPSLDKALGQAMAGAGAAGRRRVIDVIFQRGRAEGLRALLLAYHELEPVDQAALAERIDKLYRPIRQVLGMSQPQPVLNALTLIERAAETKLAYLVTDRLRYEDGPVRERAAACLLNLACAADDLPAEDLGELCKAIGSAVKRYALHEHPAVLRAMFCLTPRSMPEAYEALCDPSHAAVAPARRLLSEADDFGVRRGLLMMLGFPPLAGAASAGLRRCRERGTLAEVLAGAEHTLDLPRVQTGLMRSGQSNAYEPDPEALARWSDAARQGWVALVPRLAWDDEAKLDRLGPMLNDAHPAVRLEALGHVMALAEVANADTDQAGRAAGLVAEVCMDPDASVARVAAAWILSREHVPPRQLAGLAARGHQAVQEWAQRRLGPTVFNKLWQAWPKMPEASRSAAARAAWKLDPSVRDVLHERLAERDHKERAAEVLAALPEHGESLDSSEGESEPATNTVDGGEGCSITWWAAAWMLPLTLSTLAWGTIASAQAKEGNGRLAQVDPAEVGQRAMDGSQLNASWVLPMIGAFMVLFSVISIVSFWRKQKSNPHELVVCNRLAGRFGLSLSDRLTLWRIARGAGLSSPLALMLCPQTLHAHGRAYVASLGRNQAAAVLHRAASIRRRLFGPPILAAS